MDMQIVELDSAAIAEHVSALARILADSVNDGASISFIAPFSDEDAVGFWLHKVAPEVSAGERQLFGAMLEGRLVGTVQLITGMPPNQPHRCEIAKMIVHPSARRRGLGRQLMNAAMERAAELGKTLVTLDTRTGDSGEPLYLSVGFQVAGIIPDFALNTDGLALHGTTYMYRRL